MKHLRNNFLKLSLLGCLICVCGATIGISYLPQTFDIANGVTPPVEITLSDSNKVVADEIDTDGVARKTIQYTRVDKGTTNITFRIKKAIEQTTGTGFIKISNGGVFEKITKDGDTEISDASNGLNSITIAYRLATSTGSYCQFKLYCKENFSDKYGDSVKTSTKNQSNKTVTTDTFDSTLLSGKNYFKLEAVASGSTVVLTSITINYDCN